MSSSGGGGRPGRGRGRPSRNAHILQETGGGLDGTTLLYQITHPSLYPDVLWHSSGRKRSASFAETEQPVVAVKTEVVDDDAAEPSETTSAAIATATTIPLQTIKRTAIVTYTIEKQVELMQALQAQQQQYSALAHAKGSQRHAILEELLGPKLAKDTRYYPAELLADGSNAKKTKKAKLTDTRTDLGGAPDVAVSLDELAQQEESRSAVLADAVTSSSTTTARGKSGNDNDEEEDEEEELDQEEVIEELEEELDYNRDYYASDADSDGDGGDGEAVF